MFGCVSRCRIVLKFWILGDFVFVCVFDLVNIVYFIEMSIELDVVWMDK